MAYVRLDTKKYIATDRMKKSAKFCDSFDSQTRDSLRARSSDLRSRIDNNQHNHHACISSLASIINKAPSLALPKRLHVQRSALLR